MRDTCSLLVRGTGTCTRLCYGQVCLGWMFAPKELHSKPDGVALYLQAYATSFLRNKSRLRERFCPMVEQPFTRDVRKVEEWMHELQLRSSKIPFRYHSHSPQPRSFHLHIPFLLPLLLLLHATWPILFLQA